jgi:filamentous hemagglutinin family protein
MTSFLQRYAPVGAMLLAIATCPGAAIAQVLSDGTLPTRVGSSNGLDFRIDDGSRSGTNLFHSFRQFSVPTGGSAVFNNAADVQNIFSRVTGGTVSSIDGLVQTNGSANLFLLNPSGILFGANALLNIGGSFLGTTADSVKFADNIEFSAINPTPLLTMNVPIGLQISQNAGTITVQGPGHQISGGLFAPLNSQSSAIGLQAGKSLTLIGGDVNFAGGIITSKGGGPIEIGSIQEGLVKLNQTSQGWVGDYSTISQFKDIHLAQLSLIDASGNNGSIVLQGQNINLTEGSVALIQNFGLGRSGDLTIRATGAFNLTGNTIDGTLGSLISLENLGMGATGDINISAKQLTLKNGGIISNRAFSPAASGNVVVTVPGLILIDGVAPARPVGISSISTNTYNTNNAGDITVLTDTLSIQNGGSLASLTIGPGQAGTLRVNAASLVEIAGNNPLTLTPSTLVSTTFGSGNAKDLFIDTSKLVLRSGGIIGSSTYVTAAAGNVVINASNSVDISGKAPGSITVSRIGSTAEILDPATQRAFGLPSRPSGDAGSLTINTPLLRIADHAYVTVKNDGPGRAGNLEINGRSIFLDHQGAITAATASGNGGDVRLNLQGILLMRHGSNISATAAGQGDGGNLRINAPILLGLENSDIVANAVNGTGGNIQIVSQSVFGLKNRDRLTPENDITASSQLGVNGTVQVNTIGVTPNSELVVLPVDTVDPSQKVATGCAQRQDSSFVATGRGGMPENPAQNIRADRPWSDLRPEEKPGIALRDPLPAPAFVEASTLGINAQGQLELLAQGWSIPTHSVATCAKD